MIRLRFQVRTWPRRALVLTDTPRPDCRICDGFGGIEHEYGHPETGEYDGSHWEPCPCWNEQRAWSLLPLPNRPRWLRRNDPFTDPWASNEPPF
ncbi:hypothetical protein [Streptomyces sp. SID9124]|uniref:hypothetical protein n=1 Tax=Streptomyces sp. SID9124 TaxID=2706108 RepID=UPI0013E0B79D|nr:hypothetical protein [Streptomyces sp. SID9124]NED15788.1 hypothetical protein [Streptomyces sp. SID9124]